MRKVLLRSSEVSVVASMMIGASPPPPPKPRGASPGPREPDRGRPAVVLCSLALFLSGCAIQQRTLRDLRAAIRPRESPRARLPDRFRASTTELADGTVVLVESEAREMTVAAAGPRRGDLDAVAAAAAGSEERARQSRGETAAAAAAAARAGGGQVVGGRAPGPAQRQPRARDARAAAAHHQGRAAAAGRGGPAARLPPAEAAVSRPGGHGPARSADAALLHTEGKGILRAHVGWVSASIGRWHGYIWTDGICVVAWL